MSSSITNNNKPTITNNIHTRRSSKRTCETFLQSPPEIPWKKVKIIDSIDNDLVPTSESIDTETENYIKPITSTGINTTNTTTPDLTQKYYQMYKNRVLVYNLNTGYEMIDTGTGNLIVSINGIDRFINLQPLNL